MATGGLAGSVPTEVPGAAFTPSALPEGPTAVLFTADWCGYCRRFQPFFDKVPGGVVVDISDDDDPLWDRFGIRLVPTVILFDQGAPVRRWAGVLREPQAMEIAEAVSAQVG